MPTIKLNSVDDVKLLPIRYITAPITTEAQVIFFKDLKGNSHIKTFLDTIIMRINRIAYPTSVVTAAAIYPYLGIKRKLSDKLSIPATTIQNMIGLVFL